MKYLKTVLLLVSISTSLSCVNTSKKAENKAENIDERLSEQMLEQKEGKKEKLIDFDVHQLIEEAKKARGKAYCPYSNFQVGAALLTESGKIYTGANVENASYGLTCCAERNAIFKAVLEGDKKIKAIAIVLDAPDFGAPCGACRQVINEFGKDALVIMATVNGKCKVEPMPNLLPYAFNLDA